MKANRATEIAVQNKLLAPRPFVKWVGGKRSITEQLKQRLPNKINDYYEPFVGGGALFFEVAAKTRFSYLSDLNHELITAYKVIKDNKDELIGCLVEHQCRHSKDYFYEIRKQKELTDLVEIAARFIYLMKTCFNGLYRVNSKGEFNTPLGSYKNPNICDAKNIEAVSLVLQNAEITYQDFTAIKPQKGDFVYFDPPYHPLNGTSFVKYVSNGFTRDDQIRLRDFALKLAESGVNVMLSNSDTGFIHELYGRDFKIEKVAAPRFVNSKADGRGKVFETLITSY